MLLAVCPVNCCLSMPAGVDHMQIEVTLRSLLSQYSLDDMCVIILQQNELSLPTT